jgi:hypothetical protein
MARSRRRTLSRDEQHVLDHLQVRRVSSPKDKARCDQLIVIPVLITENTANPFQVLKKSTLTLTKTWGESLIGYAGVSFGGAIIALISLVWLAGGVAFSLAYHLYWLTVLVVLAWLIVIILWSYTLSVASQIFRCALFVYASKGTLPPPYT